MGGKGAFKTKIHMCFLNIRCKEPSRKISLPGHFLDLKQLVRFLGEGEVLSSTEPK